jgi:hypothetical protein
MTAAIQDLLAAFDALTPAEQHELAVEILRRSMGTGEMPEAGYDELASELLRAYDAGEGATLLNCDEAIRFIEQIPDRVTKNLVNMAFVYIVNQVHLEKRDRPRSDLDMLFLVTTLKDFFADHQVLARTLQGEKVGAWFDEGT